MVETSIISRAQGCLMGQFAGDSLGALVESMPPDKIHQLFPSGLREHMSGGVHNIIAGQPSDDSEMAMALAKTIQERRDYSPEAALEAYQNWANSNPFDIGKTIFSAIGGLIQSPIFMRHSSGYNLKMESQTNGAMMRISPLAIFGANYSAKQVAEWAKQDCVLTHINPICIQANQLYACGIAYAIKSGLSNHDVFAYMSDMAHTMEVEPVLLKVFETAKIAPPADFMFNSDWVLIAFHNALWQLLHADNTEEAVVDTVMRGGDTDTNACICGAMLGAVYGIESVPQKWIDAVINCHPEAGNELIPHPRPEYYWPGEILSIALVLVLPNDAWFQLKDTKRTDDEERQWSKVAWIISDTARSFNDLRSMDAINILLGSKNCAIDVKDMEEIEKKTGAIANIQRELVNIKTNIDSLNSSYTLSEKALKPIFGQIVAGADLATTVMTLVESVIEECKLQNYPEFISPENWKALIQTYNQLIEYFEMCFDIASVANDVTEWKNKIDKYKETKRRK